MRIKTCIMFVLQEKSDNPVCFLSYCWYNSLQAVMQNDTPRIESALGPVDPRELKTFLEMKCNISCWLDIEQVGQVGSDFLLLTMKILCSRFCAVCGRFTLYNGVMPFYFILLKHIHLFSYSFNMSI